MKFFNVHGEVLLDVSTVNDMKVGLDDAYATLVGQFPAILSIAAYPLWCDESESGVVEDATGVYLTSEEDFDGEDCDVKGIALKKFQW